MFSASDVKELREKTGAGMLDCKKALQESEGNMEKAIDWLREKGISKAAKKESRIAAEGLSEILVDGNKAVILILDDLHDSIESSENISWHYDTDFEFLNDDNIKQIIVTGVRHLDTYVRLRLADIPKRKIEHMKDEIDATKKIKLKNIDSIYILYDVYTVHLRDKVKDKLKEIIDKEEV